MFVYVIVNSATLKIYIGQHKGTNLRRYLQQKLSEARRGISARSYLYASMRKHPKEVWSIHPLISDLQTRQECDKWERHYIRVLNAQHLKVGYNIAPGGEGFEVGHVVSSETRRKVSQAQLGRKQSVEHIQKRVDGRKLWDLRHDPRQGRVPKQTIIDAYLGGESAGSLGKKVGLSGSTIIDLLRKWDVPRRSAADSLKLAYAVGRKDKQWGIVRWSEK